jgi:hypothetical protein
MKKNIEKVIDKLEIDPGARNLVRQLWKHGYKVKFSCEGHPGLFGIRTGAYIHFKKGTGDGWFEQYAHEYGLKRAETVQYPLMTPDAKPHIIYRGRYIHHPETKHRKVLGRNMLFTVFITCILLSLIFFSSNLTGFVIMNLTNKTSNIIGVILFFIGVICGYLRLRKKYTK